MALLCIEGRLIEVRVRRSASSYDRDLFFRGRYGPQRLRRVHVPPLIAPFLDQGRDGIFCFQTVWGHATLCGARFGEDGHMARAELLRGMALHFGLAALLSVAAVLSHGLTQLPALTSLLATMALYHLAHVLLDSTARARAVFGTMPGRCGPPPPQPKRQVLCPQAA